MECTGFLQGCYSSRDLNMGVHGSAPPPCNNERMFKSSYCYNVFVPSLSRDQFLVHEKEILRRTILKHDLVFRDQVSELHRLHRRQRELMDEIRRAEIAKQNLQLQRSQSNSLSDQRQWQTPGLPWVNLAASRPSFSTAENFQSTSSFIERKSTRAELDTVLAEANLEERKLWHSKSKKKMLDLELPADEYIDSEEEDLYGNEKASKGPELPCYSSKKLPEDSRKSDLKLFPCSNLPNSICHGGSSRPDPFFRITNDFIDLNEPVWLKAAAASNPFRQGRDAETCLKTTYLEDKQGELLPNCDEYGMLSMPCKQLKVELPAEFPTANPLDDCDRKLQDQVADSVREKSERNASLSDDDYRQLVSPCLPTSCRLVPQSDGVKSQPFSSCPKPTHYANQNPIAVQALPRFNSVLPSYMSTESSSGSPLLNGNRSDCSRNMNRPGVGSFSPPQNSHWFGSQLETTTAASLPSIGFSHPNYDTATVHMNCFQRPAAGDPNSAKIMDLNMPPDVETANGVEKIEESQATLLVPQEKLDYDNTPNEEKEDLSRIDLASSQASSTSVSHAGPKRLKTRDCAGDENILVSDNFDKPGVCTSQFPHLSSSSNFHPDASEKKNTQSSLKDGMVNGYSASSPPASSGKLCTADNVSVDIMADTKLSGLGNQIDLNSCIIENEPLPIVKVKNAIEIDLEAPVSPENQERSPPRGDSEENQLYTHFQLSEMEDRDQKDELVRMAAEAIVLISAPSSASCR
ncbi:uncharacterized protein LOC127793185 isoform X2 [Diospyros lotus]|uniref:uncharacterized protein LOC127793185 isoform X2 n=1 Tax=Diospyros lotus TaxID=55363 RepID=UPI002251671B|nr:uncharacterized protein LOC127793185 isoform X2 [Diospyros lotus]